LRLDDLAVGVERGDVQPWVVRLALLRHTGAT
jgi:hypothetical protein